MISQTRRADSSIYTTFENVFLQICRNKTYNIINEANMRNCKYLLKNFKKSWFSDSTAYFKNNGMLV